MRIIRVRRPQGVDHIEALLDCDAMDLSREAYSQSLRVALDKNPDSIFFALAYEDDPGTVHGFAIAVADPGRSFSYLLQAWTNPEFVERGFKERAFKAICEWSKGLGRLEIRAETKRNVDALHRSWGFKEHSVIVKLSLVPQDEVIEETVKENNNGRRQQTEDGINSDVLPAADRVVAGEDHPTPSGPEGRVGTPSDAVHGSESSGSDTGDGQGEGSD